MKTSFPFSGSYSYFRQPLCHLTSVIHLNQLGRSALLYSPDSLIQVTGLDKGFIIGAAAVFGFIHTGTNIIRPSGF